MFKFIHYKQVIDRDIKSENIIMKNKDNQLALVDFGAAKFATMNALGQTGTIIVQHPMWRRKISKKSNFC